MTEDRPPAATVHPSRYLQLVQGWAQDGRRPEEPVPAAPETLEATAPPADPPTGLPFKPRTFQDWSEYTTVDEVLHHTADNGAAVAALCTEIAQKSTWKVRALGHSHNWSPLIIPAGPPAPPVFLIDTGRLESTAPTTYGNGAAGTFGTGTTLENATAFLAGLDNHGASPAPGYSFLNMPTPGGLSLGGILAVGGHGTSVPGSMAEPGLMGCLSNLVVSFKAVVSDPAHPDEHVYTEQSFDRSHPEASAFLVHLGRAFLTEVTLAAVPNYYLQLTNLFPVMTAVMAPSASTPNSLASLLDAHGRVEVIWFPNQPLAWVQCLTRQDRRIDPQVAGPYYDHNWMNSIPKQASETARDHMIQHPSLVLLTAPVEAADAWWNMDGYVANGTARDLEIYLKDTTLRMHACGYALHLQRKDVQAAANEFQGAFQKLLDRYQGQGMYPVNGPVEIRCTTIDRPGDLRINGAQPPALAATHSIDGKDSAFDTVLWLDVLTFPGTPSAWQFFAELENWMITTWHKRWPGRLRPEWSKGWAYTADGPWKNPTVIDWVHNVYNSAADDLTFDWAERTLAKYDSARIFTNSFLDTLFS